VKLGHDGKARHAVWRQSKEADGRNFVGFGEEFSSALARSADACSENATIRKTAADSFRNAGPVAFAFLD
jgi:hypothetical protein